MGEAEVTRFLTHLAVDGKLSASTQNQALSAILFLYRHVLGSQLAWLDDVVRAKRPSHLPVVLMREEVAAILRELHGVERLMASLLYGSGLRLLECCRLRVQDVESSRSELTIRNGKGAKDRVAPLPCFNARSEQPCCARASLSVPPATRCDIPSPRISSRTATTSAPSRSCLATAT